MKRAILAGLIAASTFGFAQANDTMAELGTGGLAFTRSDAIEMLEEHLFVSEREIRVDYLFRNKSGKDVESIVAFPMPDIEGDPELMVAIPDWESDNFLDFKVTQDGKPIETQLDQRAFAVNIDVTEKIKAAGLPMTPFGEKAMADADALDAAKAGALVAEGILLPQEWDVGNGMETHHVPVWSLRSTYWWKTVFPAGTTVSVSHSYKTGMGGTTGLSFLGENGKPGGEVWEERKKKYCADKSFEDAVVRAIDAAADDQKYSVYFENWIHYVLTTGNNWAGPIGKFTLTIDKGSPENLISFCGENVRKTGPTTFEMTASDYYPSDDLHVLLLKKQGAQ